MSYKIFITVITVTLTLCALSHANASDTTRIRISKNAFYVQLSGKGNARSLNYERVFFRGRKMNYSYSAGFSLFNKDYSVPISLNAITTAPKHHFEASVTFTPYVEKHMINESKDIYDRDKQMYIRTSIGYRYQKPGTGFFLKVGAGPQIFMDPPSNDVWNFTPKLVKPSAHLALGISF